MTITGGRERASETRHNHRHGRQDPNIFGVVIEFRQAGTSRTLPPALEELQTPSDRKIPKPAHDQTLLSLPGASVPKPYDRKYDCGAIYTHARIGGGTSHCEKPPLSSSALSHPTGDFGDSGANSNETPSMGRGGLADRSEAGR